jgi:hypothetical protein
MRRPANMRRVPPAPIEENFFIRLAAGGLASIMADLRRRVEHTGTRRSIAQVLLAQAHIDEAVGLLSAIPPTPRVREFAFRRAQLGSTVHACSQVQRAGRRHRAHGI